MKLLAKISIYFFCLFFINSISAQNNYGLKIDKSKQERILITTDLEVDDMNGILLSLIYSDQYDLAGIVWTSGMYHFSGDGGKHTLGEITPNFRCNAQHCEHRVKSAADLTEYRPADPTWLDRILDFYEEDFEFMSKNNPNFPDPDYLRKITKVGNIEFEGDYRFETEGSNFIMNCILDDDERILNIQHWGGINTTIRALYSIYEKYHDTNQWEAILNKVVNKVRFRGNGEDNCRKDSKIDEMFPGLNDGKFEFGFFNYGSFFASSYNSPRRSSDELQKYLHADYILDAYKNNHGKLTGEIWLMGEGRSIFGEPIIYNYGLITYMDWAKSAELGWGPESLKDFKRADFKPFDWGICQFGTASHINIGLRKDLNNRNDYFTIKMWEELAARADWAIMLPENCNHPPILSSEKLEFRGKPGDKILMKGEGVDPDGNKLIPRWWVPNYSSTYKEGKGENLKVSNQSSWKTEFSIPMDAKPGDLFAVNLEVVDEADRPMTRFIQYLIEVE